MVKTPKGTRAESTFDGAGMLRLTEATRGPVGGELLLFSVSSGWHRFLHEPPLGASKWRQTTCFDAEKRVSSINIMQASGQQGDFRPYVWKSSSPMETRHNLLYEASVWRAACQHTSPLKMWASFLACHKAMNRKYTFATCFAVLDRRFRRCWTSFRR